MKIENYQGPGIYKHYKGDHYIVAGLVRLEWNDGVGVAYMTLDPDHREEQFYRQMLFTIRPLNEADGKDCWNSMVPSPKFPPDFVPRFRKIA